MIWTQLIVLVASHFLQAALAPRAEPPPAATLDDFDIPTPEQGRIIPKVYGRARLKGLSVVYSGNFYKQDILSETSKK